MRKEIFLLGEMSREKIFQALGLGVEGLFVGNKNLQEKACRELKEKGIKVYVEVSLFAGEEWWQQYPDSRPVNREGKLMEKVEWYAGICPNHPEVRKEKLQLIKSLIQDFDIDGIWLDFIRYPCHWEVPNPDLTEYCFCSYCLEKFSQEVGGEPKGKRWVQWKCNQITDFVSQARTLIDQSGKRIELGMFSVPWKEEDFDGAIKKVIGQDFKKLAKYIDIFSPMVYHKMCGQPTDWIYEIVSYMDKVTGKPILPIVQTEDKPEKISKKEFKKEIEEAVKEPSQGAIIFFLEDLLKDRNKMQVLSAKYN